MQARRRHGHAGGIRRQRLDTHGSSVRDGRCFDRRCSQALTPMPLGQISDGSRLHLGCISARSQLSNADSEKARKVRSEPEIRGDMGRYGEIWGDGIVRSKPEANRRQSARHTNVSRGSAQLRGGAKGRKEPSPPANARISDACRE